MLVGRAFSPLKWSLFRWHAIFFWGSSGHTQRFLWGCCQQIFAKQNPRPAPWRVSGSCQRGVGQLQNDTRLATNTVALSAAGSFPHANSRIYLVKSRFWATAFESIGVLDIFNFDVNVSPTPWEQKRTSFSILRSPSLHLWPPKERFCVKQRINIVLSCKTGYLAMLLHFKRWKFPWSFVTILWNLSTCCIFLTYCRPNSIVVQPRGSSWAAYGEPSWKGKS